MDKASCKKKNNAGNVKEVYLCKFFLDQFFPLREKYEKMDEEKKKEFDVEKLWNPFGDSTALRDTGSEIKKIMAGIDIDTSE